MGKESITKERNKLLEGLIYELKTKVESFIETNGDLDLKEIKIGVHPVTAFDKEYEKQEKKVNVRLNTNSFYFASGMKGRYLHSKE